MVPTLGTELADTATITVIVSTSTPLTESISVCTTVGTVVISVATVTAPPASLLATEAASEEALLNGIQVEEGTSSAGAVLLAATEVWNAEALRGLSTDVVLRRLRGASRGDLAAAVPIAAPIVVV
jgi:hypothetical protein